jgi:hypothetical protein
MQTNQEAYERLVFDGAANLARHGQDTQGMQDELEGLYTHKNMTPNQDLITEVLEAQQASNYHPVIYRGVMADEGVIECLKDILREVYHNEIYQ